MAGKGPAPSDPAKRKGNDRTFAMTELPTSATVKPPPLPKTRVTDPATGKTRLVEHRQETKSWYDTWKKSPQAGMFTSTDWLRLHMLAPLVDIYFMTVGEGQGGKAKELLGEIRLNEAKLGATPEDRLRLRWKIGEPEQPEEHKETSRRRHEDPRANLKLVGGSKTG